MTSKLYDIFIIGGGINGCGVARDAQGRGYSVCLAEMNDLASGTSSWSTKLIHGGLRYLEHYEFRLVREALIEREILWQMAPHIVRPLRFILPHHKGLRPAWLIRLGLFMYDYIGGRKKLAPTKTINLAKDPAGKPLKPLFSKGFEYSDCWVDDARLVILNAVDAAEAGADIKTRTKVTSLRRVGGLWQILMQDMENATTETVNAKLVVNASGPWVDQVLKEAAGNEEAQNVRMVQGSHIAVRKLYDHDRCYIFQNEDDRIIFAIPYEDDLTLIGTTDQDYDGDPAEVEITPQEIDYLCEAASEYFKNDVTKDQIVWTYSGVRPLYDDGANAAQEATRDYTLKIDDEAEGEAILVNIFGGKITTFRKLAESVMEIVQDRLGQKGPSWTRGAALPGGDFGIDEIGTLAKQLIAQNSELTQRTAQRLINAYGRRALQMFESRVSDTQGLGIDFSGEAKKGLYAAEIDYLMDHEWARTPQDVLWRRSKLGIYVTPQDVETLRTYMAARIK